MCDHARRHRNGEQLRDAILDALATNPLSEREIFNSVSGCNHGYEGSRRALDMLIGSGEVARSGVRASFDHGVEVLFKKRAGIITCHTTVMKVYPVIENDC